jgi:hypothetical protein
LPKENPNQETHDFVQSAVEAGYENLGRYIEQAITSGKIRVE